MMVGSRLTLEFRLVRQHFLQKNLLVHVEAMVRVLGCVCDNNGNYALDFDEFNSEVCVDVQHWMFGGTLDEEGFEAADQDSNGEIDGHEAADAIEYYFDNMHSK